MPCKQTEPEESKDQLLALVLHEQNHKGNVIFTWASASRGPTQGAFLPAEKWAPADSREKGPSASAQGAVWRRIETNKAKDRTGERAGLHNSSFVFKKKKKCKFILKLTDQSFRRFGHSFSHGLSWYCLDWRLVQPGHVQIFNYNIHFNLLSIYTHY